MTEPSPTYRVLDPNQPNPDKMIADAAREAYDSLVHFFVDCEMLNMAQVATIFEFLRVLTEYEIACTDARLADLDAEIARIDMRLSPE